MKKIHFVLAAVIISNQLSAQTDSTGKLMDEAVVTANKYQRKQSETGKVLIVINRDQLEKSSGKTLGELLNSTAGVTIIGANNTPGTNHTTSIRGGAAGNALILVDGIPINDPSVNNNYFDLNYFSIEQVERIEIMKGGQSTLYGSDAVNGVINIILRKAVDMFNGNVLLSGGSYGTFKEHIGLDGRNKSISWQAAYTHLGSKGFSAAFDSSGTSIFDKDGIDQHVATTRLGIKTSKNASLDVFGNYSFYKADLDAALFTDEKDYTVKTKNAQAGIGYRLDHKKSSLHIRYSFNYVERRYLDDSTYKSSPYVDYAVATYIGRTHYAEIYHSMKWTNWEWLAGVDFRYNNTYQHYFSTGMFGPYAPPDLHGKMNQLSPYTSFVYRKNNFTGEFGGRLNLHSEYGNNFSVTINPLLQCGKEIKLFGNFYTAFKTPTLYQLFDPSAGNPKLEPEESAVGELGIEYFQEQHSWFRVTGFYRKTKDAIVYTFDPMTFASKYLNASEQKNYGVEIESRLTVDKLSILANYTYTDGKTTAEFDGTGAPLGKDTTYFNLYRIPKHAFNLGIGCQLNNALYISTQVRAVSKRDEYIYGNLPETLKHYATLDLYGEYKWGKRLKLFLDLKNITNKKYFDLLGYNSKRFNCTGGIRFSF